MGKFLFAATVQSPLHLKCRLTLRMEQAKLLLRETNEPVSAICRRVGYNDIKHFTRTFEKDTGVKPATYRKLYG